MDQQRQEALTRVASIFSLDSENASHAKGEGCGGCVGGLRRSLCLEFSTWSLREGAHQRQEKALWSILDGPACRDTGQCSNRILSHMTLKPSWSDSARAWVTKEGWKGHQRGTGNGVAEEHVTEGIN